MTISYPLMMPGAPGFARVAYHTANNVGIARSPYTYKRQVQDFGAASWAVEVTLPPIDGLSNIDIVRQWEAFLFSLKGIRGSTYFGDPIRRTPVGLATGAPRISGVGILGGSVQTTGWTNSTNGLLKPGDKVQIANRLYVNLTELNSDSSGNATMDVWPEIVTAPPDTEPIVTNDPKGIFSLVESAIKISEADEGHIYTFNFSLVEVI